MTYNTPELLLVGAAQNLVLQTSDFVQKENALPPCNPDPQIDLDARSPVEYNTIQTW